MNARIRQLRLFSWVLSSILMTVGAVAALAEVIIYPAPQGEPLSRDYKLEVNGQPVDIYLAKIADVQNPPDWALKPGQLGGPYSFAYFDFSGTVTVKITSLKKPLDKLVIRPDNGIIPRVEGHTVSFTLNEPCKLSIEPDDVREPLLIFANPLEADPPRPGDPGVIYFGPGIHKPNRITVSSGQTLYIAGGAVVKAAVSVSGHNIKIRGRGILCGDDWSWRQGPGRLLGLERASNVSIEGIILRGAWSWTLPIYNSDSVTITNVKICGGKNPNDDGINPCNSQHIVIRDCFIRTDDDCIAMKGIRYGSANDNVEHILVENCILWCDRARIFLLGHESRAPFMRHIILRNLDIIHFSMTPFLFEPGEEMCIEDVFVENVRLIGTPETTPRQVYRDFITLHPTVNQYMRKKVPGRIRNITFRNITLTGDRKPDRLVWIKGADPDHTVTDVVFDNVNCLGRVLTKYDPQVRIEEFAENIRFITPATGNY